MANDSYSASDISVKGLSDVINSTGAIDENDNLLTALAKLQNQISAAQSALFAKVPFQSGSLIFKKDEVQEPVWNNYNDKQIRKLSGSTLNAVDAGTYSVIFSLLDGYKWEDDGTLGDRVVQWSIKEATVAKLPSPKSSLLYNGTVQAPEWLDYNSDELALGGFSRATEAGEYTATFIPKKNYVWYDGTTTEKAVKWTIRSSEIEVISSEALPTASTTQKGGVKIGSGLAMNGEILNCTVSSGTLAVATSSANGLMSSTDKNKLDKLNSLSYVPRPMLVTFTIPVDAWIENSSEESEFIYYADIDATGLTVNDYAEVTFDRASQSIIAEANICTSGETLDDKIRIYAENIPINAISGQYIVIKGAV